MFSQNFTFCGLGTFTMSIPIAGLYFFRGKLSLPQLTQGSGPSACLVTINQNGSPVYTGTAGAEGFETNFVCALNDVITIVFSSSAAADLPLNVIKSTMSVWLGP